MGNTYDIDDFERETELAQTVTERLEVLWEAIGPPPVYAMPLLAAETSVGYEVGLRRASGG